MRRPTLASLLFVAFVLTVPARAHGPQNGARSLPKIFQRGKPPLSWQQIDLKETVPDVRNSAVSGPDGNMWVSASGDGALLRVGMDGDVTAFPLTVKKGGKTFRFYPNNLTVGADEKFYLGGCIVAGSIGTCSVVGVASTAGVLTVYEIPSGDILAPYGGLTLGPDGNVWLAEAAHVGKITPAGTITEYHYPSGIIDDVSGIAAGSDGAMWTVETDFKLLARTSVNDGSITEYPLTCQPAGSIAPAKDGNLYFPCFYGSSVLLGRVDRNLHVTLITNPLGSIGYGTANLTRGPDGNVWFLPQGSELGEFDVAARRFTAYQPPPPSYSSGENALTGGSDGNIWITDQSGHVVVFIRNLLDVTPKRALLNAPGDTATLAVMYGGHRSLRAKTLNSAVATVSAGSSNQSFVITAQGPGTTTIVISDGIGNTFDVPVVVK